MAGGEDELEIDDAEILQILEETLYKTPVTPAIHVAAPSSLKPHSQIGEPASILRKVKKPTGNGLSTPGLRDYDQLECNSARPWSLLETASGVGTKRKVLGGEQKEVAQASQINRLDSNQEDVPCLLDSEEDSPRSPSEEEESPLEEEAHLIESPVRSPLAGVLPYTIPGPAGHVQKTLNAGKNARFRHVSPGRMKGGNEDGELGTEDTRFMEEPWLRAVGALSRHGGESTTVSMIRCRDFEGHVSKFVAVIVALSRDGFGGAFVTLEDPTGKISGTIHKSVFKEPKYAESLASGAILLLQNVPIFRPHSRARLISITATNVIQVIKEGNEIGSEIESSERPSQSGVKRKEAPTKYCGTVETSKTRTHSPLEAADAPNSSVQPREEKVGEGKGCPEDAKFTDPHMDVESERMAAVAKAAGWDLEEDLDQLLDCSLEDLYN